MKKISVIVVGIVLLAVAGGGIFLATWNIPAPVADIEKVVPDDRFPR